MSYYHQPEYVRDLRHAHKILDKRFPDRREAKPAEPVEGGWVSHVFSAIAVLAMVGMVVLILAIPQ